MLIGAQCSGTLVLARLGLVGGVPACTDLLTKPWVIARTEGLEAAASALHCVAPVGEKDSFVANALARITPYLPA